MRIILKNFKCYKSGEFKFPNKGLVLLHGESGSGKSTILKAILYALFGVCKRPCIFGEKSCQVYLECNSLEITRTHGPKSLIVVFNKETFQADHAQSIINASFGSNITKDEFISSCVVQRSKNSILALKPADQLEFVKKLAFDIEESKELKDKIKKKIVEAKGHYQNLKTSSEISQKLANESNSRLQKIPIVEGEKVDILEQENIASKKREKLKELHSQLKEASKISSQKERILRLDGSISSLEEKIKITPLKPEENVSLKEIEEVRQSLELIDLKERCSLLEKNKENLEKQIKEIVVDEELPLKHISLTEQIFKIKEIEEERLELLEKNKESIEEIKKITPILKKVGKFKKGLKLEELKVIIEECIIMINKGIQSKKKLKCPSCNTDLTLKEGILVKEEFDTPFDEKELILWLNICTSCLEHINTVSSNRAWIKANYKKKEFEDIHSQYKEVSQLIEERLAKKEKIQTLKGELHVCEREISKTKRDFNINQNHTREYFDSLIEKRKKYEKEEYEYNSLISNISSTKKELFKLKKERDDLSKNLKEFNINEISIEINEVTDEIKTINENISKTKEIILFENTEQEAKKYIKEYHDISDKLNEAGTILEGFYGVQEAYKEAELIAIQDYVETINNSAILYLSQFFQEPISILLSPNIEKSKLETCINFNEKIFEHFEDLSDGQQQRAELSFCLGMSDIFGINTLILDECLNNIEPELNSHIISFLQEIGKEKLVLVVSHEAIQGKFDVIVHVKK